MKDQESKAGRMEGGRDEGPGEEGKTGDGQEKDNIISSGHQVSVLQKEEKEEEEDEEKEEEEGRESWAVLLLSLKTPPVIKSSYVVLSSADFQYKAEGGKDERQGEEETDERERRKGVRKTMDWENFQL